MIIRTSHDAFKLAASRAKAERLPLGSAVATAGAVFLSQSRPQAEPDAARVRPPWPVSLEAARELPDAERADYVAAYLVGQAELAYRPSHLVWWPSASAGAGSAPPLCLERDPLHPVVKLATIAAGATLAGLLGALVTSLLGGFAGNWDGTAALIVEWALPVLCAAMALLALAGGFNRTSTRVVAHIEAGTAVIAFRGTISLLQLVATDGMILPWGRPLRHFGFLKAWTCVRDDVRRWVDRYVPSGMPILLTGHSLGGALAHLAAFDLIDQHHVEAVATFGAPRAGFGRFCEAYDRKRRPGSPASERALGARTRRYTHATDLVSRVPPPILFQHVGEEFQIVESGRITKGRPPSLIARARNGWQALKWLPMRPVEPPLAGVGLGASRPFTSGPVVSGASPAFGVGGGGAPFGYLDALSQSHFILPLINALPPALLASLVGTALAGVAIWDSAAHPCKKYRRAFDACYATPLTPVAPSLSFTLAGAPRLATTWYGPLPDTTSRPLSRPFVGLHNMSIFGATGPGTPGPGTTGPGTSGPGTSGPGTRPSE